MKRDLLSNFTAALNDARSQQRVQRQYYEASG
jgi:hypothetical protein